MGDGRGVSWLALAARGISLEDMKSSTSCRHLSEAEPGRISKVRTNKNEDDCKENDDSTVANAQMCRRLRGALLCTIFLSCCRVKMTSFCNLTAAAAAKQKSRTNRARRPAGPPPTPSFSEVSEASRHNRPDIGTPLDRWALYAFLLSGLQLCVVTSL